ncbi:MAG: C-type lectin domain-containing protein [Myxococcota bacterium]|nr:C-type lectin domain-containing protein [Deltaproteobacteria bacterium]MDQ3340513.1 C-type lectin domain-containing protein [Myxococcota bacterium]
MKGTIAVLTFVLSAGCVDEPEPVPPPPVPTQDQCPAGFGPLGTLAGCYREGASASWITAEEACEQHVSLKRKAHLIIIDREEEHLAIAAMSKQGDMWIGRMQKGSDDEYRNINYIDFVPDYFGSGEPNDYGGDAGSPGGGDERCIEYKTETGLWNDEKCYRADRVICEWDNVDPYDWRPGDQGY